MSENSEVVPNPYDVLLGRGTGVARHFGNAFFRKLVDQHRPLYQAASKFEKGAISQRIVQIIAQHGGSFVDRVALDGAVYYQPIPLKMAANKTSQALRELQKSPKRTAKIQEALTRSPVSNRIHIETSQPTVTPNTSTYSCYMEGQSLSTKPTSRISIVVPLYKEVSSGHPLKPRHNRVTRAAIQALNQDVKPKMKWATPDADQNDDSTLLEAHGPMKDHVAPKALLPVKKRRLRSSKIYTTPSSLSTLPQKELNGYTQHFRPIPERVADTKLQTVTNTLLARPTPYRLSVAPNLRPKPPVVPVLLRSRSDVDSCHSTPSREQHIQFTQPTAEEKSKGSLISACGESTGSPDSENLVSSQTQGVVTSASIYGRTSILAFNQGYSDFCTPVKNHSRMARPNIPILSQIFANELSLLTCQPSTPSSLKTTTDSTNMLQNNYWTSSPLSAGLMFCHPSKTIEKDSNIDITCAFCLSENDDHCCCRQEFRTNSVTSHWKSLSRGINQQKGTSGPSPGATLTGMSPIGKEILVPPPSTTDILRQSQLREASPSPMRMFASAIETFTHFGSYDGTDCNAKPDSSPILSSPSGVSTSHSSYGNDCWTPLPFCAASDVCDSSNATTPLENGMTAILEPVEAAKVLDFDETLGRSQEKSPQQLSRNYEWEATKDDIDECIKTGDMAPSNSVLYLFAPSDASLTTDGSARDLFLDRQIISPPHLANFGGCHVQEFFASPFAKETVRISCNDEPAEIKPITLEKTSLQSNRSRRVSDASLPTSGNFAVIGNIQCHVLLKKDATESKQAAAAISFQTSSRRVSC